MNPLRLKTVSGRGTVRRTRATTPAGARGGASPFVSADRAGELVQLSDLLDDDDDDLFDDEEEDEEEKQDEAAEAVDFPSGAAQFMRALHGHLVRRAGLLPRTLPHVRRNRLETLRHYVT